MSDGHPGDTGAWVHPPAAWPSPEGPDAAAADRAVSARHQTYQAEHLQPHPTHQSHQNQQPYPLHPAGSAYAPYEAQQAGAGHTPHQAQQAEWTEWTHAPHEAQQAQPPYGAQQAQPPYGAQPTQHAHRPGEAYVPQQAGGSRYAYPPHQAGEAYWPQQTQQAPQPYPSHQADPAQHAYQANRPHQAEQGHPPHAPEQTQQAQQAQQAYPTHQGGEAWAPGPQQAQHAPQAHPFPPLPQQAQAYARAHRPHEAEPAHPSYGDPQVQHAHLPHQAGETRAYPFHAPHGAEPAQHAYLPHQIREVQAHPTHEAQQTQHAYLPHQAGEARAYGPGRAQPSDPSQPSHPSHEAEPAQHAHPSPRTGHAPADQQQRAPQGDVPEADGPAGGRKAARLAREAEGTGGGGRRGRAKAPAAPQTARGRRRAGGRDGSGDGLGAGPEAAGPEAAADREARPNPRRRRARLVKAVAFCAATAACAMLVIRSNEALEGLAAPADPDSAAAAPMAVADAPDPGRVLQIIAHPDDDLYFMNPDLRYSIAAGHPVTSVYLTSGEADGINAVAGKEAGTAPNKPAYAEARQNGIRAAYAKMATGDRGSAWKRSVVPTKGGGHAEVDVLVAKPQVNLVWLQLREAGNVYDDVPESLHGLWDGKVARLDSMVASGSPVKQRFSYSKDQVVQTLVGVLEQYKPTTVRSQDPTPGRFPDTKRYTDHQDHFYGARFVQLATAAYAKDVKDRPHFAVQNYLGYFNGSLPSALDPDEAKEKLDILDTYAWLDRQNHCGSDAGCGDLKISDHPGGNRWSDSINYARGNSTTWLASDKEHGLWAFKVLDGQVAVWHRPGLVGRWKGPDLLPGTGMDPGVSTVTIKDGRIAAFGTRTSFGAKPTDYKREVVYTVQERAGADRFGEWQSLGTPEAADENWTSDISSPAVSVDGTGQAAAYVRDGSYTLRGRVQQADGSWGPWEKYGGSDLHGSPATATDGAGRRMVFSATSKTVVGWVQPKPGAPLGPVSPTGLPDTTLPLTAEGREGGVRLWFRKPGSGNVRTALMTGDGGLKLNNMTDLGGLQGFGSVTASGHVLAGRSAGGQLGSEVGPGRPWERSPLMFVGAPSSVMLGKSMVSLAVVGLDARLYVTSSADAPDAYLAPWQPVGPRNTAP
ncbi:PIG-L family deacetylase [Streptomyces sp. NPDC002120]|uniref:PIG-L family deacetylase n=1 Tax=Streptomyces sp. NPDC002120 TaxID=3364631 RepID=UPI003696E678